ncbi:MULTISPECIES: SRPBCC family protein [unclassified Nocardioides]|uniref:SRPBCC family protein n=1 Tax=unclassified Nocardioides TaxID=2615069 RepID=UPI0000570C3B|nr:MULTISPECIES: SRPBCC family protein [unclassified Nocardioides]ABL79777.1 carbon monoxide dehydrogenase subunit G [Nocardioides sp. JS614]
MLLSNDFEVGQPIDKVWAFFGDVPQVAACLPGAELTEDLGDDTYGGGVGIRMGPVKLEFDGKARILERDDATKRMVIDASGADTKGRGQASMTVTAALTSVGRGTKVHLEQDLQLSGAAAQYGRGMISDVTTVLMGQFAANAQQRIDALERGETVSATAKPASGLAIGLQAARMALMRVFRRFFLPYRPADRPELRSR